LAKSVVLTTGTFMGGLMHIGDVKLQGGRIGEPPSYGISEQLREYGFTVGRMKTGTPARIDGRSIDFTKMTEQPGDFEGRKFGFLDYSVDYKNHKSCYITYTSPAVHKELEKGFKASPLFNGTIDGIGPRYCPSIEDKIVTFSDKERHQLFLEPEGLSTVEYYINGFSSSLPWEVQYKALRLVDGLENVKIFRPGYAIEYDYYPPTQLKHTLETKTISNLYFAGQINGTTGYEEAGAQGIMAGINAHLKIKGGDQFVLGRDQAYIGVLIDDLIGKGVDEPYRMFTSRAEYRILLRQDNADERLTPLARDIGLASEERVKQLEKKRRGVKKLRADLSNYIMELKSINVFLERAGTTKLKEKTKLINIAKRPQVQLRNLVEYCEIQIPINNEQSALREEIIESVEIEIKYDGYIMREKNMAEKIGRLEKIRIPTGIEYDKFKSISTEARQKLLKNQPETIGQASRIPGVSPSDISVLLIYMGR
jgi:tRNA uridine 5-carboxymethylaminomethyl modification enzyme